MKNYNLGISHLFQLVLLSMLTAWFVPQSGAATEIPIENHSFENPVYADGVFTEGQPVVGWIGEGGTEWGIANPNAFYFSGTVDSAPGPSPIDGFNAAHINVGSKMKHDVAGVVIQPNTIYTLSLLAGHRNGVPFVNGSASLWTGSDLLAEVFPNPPNDKWIRSSLSYTSPPSGPLIGKSLRIELKSQGPGGPQPWFDDVHLSMEPAPPCTPRKAKAVARVVNGFVIGATLTDGGCGYTNTPVVLIEGGGGSGAQAQVTVANGEVTAIQIVNAGSGYTSVPRIVISSPPSVPTVEIQVSKVNVIQNVVIGWKYVLESSPNNLDWTPTGPSFTAETDPIITEFSVESVGRFFRLMVVH